MGGYGSGPQRGSKAVIEDGLVLSLPKLMKDRLVIPGASREGSLIWKRIHSGKQVASIRYAYDLRDDGNGWIDLIYAITPHGGDPIDIRDRIPMTTTRPHLGGKRWWFVCHYTGALAAKLYLPAGVRHFAARRAYRLSYRSQKETTLDREMEKCFAIRRKLGCKGGLDWPLPDKPKGMHWKSYRQFESAYVEAETRVRTFAARRFGLVTIDMF